MERLHSNNSGTVHSGAAIISVLVVLALCTMVVSGLFAKEYVTLRSVDNRAALSQIRWMERAVLDWVQVALRFDANNDARANKLSDECSEPWSVFIDRETQLDETTTGGISLSTADKPAIISGQVKDAQGRFNLNNLIDKSKAPVVAVATKQLEAFKRILNNLQLAEGIADTLTQHLMLTVARVEGERQIPATKPAMIFVEELLALPGFTPETLRKLEKFVFFLPSQTTVNVNFAEPEVLAAVMEGLSMGDARRNAQVSGRCQPIHAKDKIAAAFGAGGNAGKALNLDLVDVKSDYFLIEGNVRYDRMEVRTEALIKRDRVGPRVEVVWQQRK